MTRLRCLPSTLCLVACLAVLVSACCGQDVETTTSADDTAAPGVDCTVLAEVTGPEDFDVELDADAEPDRLLVSSQDRRQGAEGALYSVSVRPKTRGLTRRLELKGRGGCSFRPHGMFLHRSGEKEQRLYVINHHEDALDRSADRSCVPEGAQAAGRSTSVEVFKIDRGSLQMTRRLAHAELLDNGNDLVVADDGTVYVTVPPTSPWKQGWEQAVGGSYSKIVRYRQDADREERWSVVAWLPGFANGIELDEDHLVVSTSTGGEIFRLPKDGEALRDLVPVPSPPGMHDNFTWHGQSLLLASHSDARRFLQHAQDGEALSGWAVWRLSADQGDWTPIAGDNGALASGVSTAACVGSELILGQVFGGSILSCHGPCADANLEVKP